MKTRLFLTLLAIASFVSCAARSSQWPPPNRVDKPAAEGLYAGKCPLGLEEISKDTVFIDGTALATFAASAPARKQSLDDAATFITKFNEIMKRDYGEQIRPGAANLTLRVRRIDLQEDDKVKYPSMVFETVDGAGTVVHAFMYEYPMSLGPSVTGGAMGIYVGEYLKKVCAPVTAR